MAIRFDAHARARMRERGAGEDEVIATVELGEGFQAKFRRSAFRRNFVFNGLWRGKHYNVKQIEAYAAWEDPDWVVVTVIVRYF